MVRIVLHHRSHTHVKLFVKLITAFLIGYAENCPISFPVRLLIQKLFCASDKGLKIDSYVPPQIQYLRAI